MWLQATYYGEYPGGGLCSLDPPPPLANQPDWVKIAVGKDDFQGSMGCGMCVEISGIGSEPIKGMVYDLCKDCKQGKTNPFSFNLFCSRFFPTH